MFNFKYKEHNSIYNNLVKLSRNTFFYKDINLNDKLENRIVLIFAHLCIIIKSLKSNQKYSNFSQELYDNIFRNIENDFREMGHGDVTVNKKMKLCNRMFHDILIKFVEDKNNNNINIKGITKFLYKTEENLKNNDKIIEYFNKYRDFCFDIVNRNMIKDFDKFKY